MSDSDKYIDFFSDEEDEVETQDNFVPQSVSDIKHTGGAVNLKYDYDDEEYDDDDFEMPSLESFGVIEKRHDHVLPMVDSIDDEDYIDSSIIENEFDRDSIYLTDEVNSDLDDVNYTNMLLEDFSLTPIDDEPNTTVSDNFKNLIDEEDDLIDEDTEENIGDSIDSILGSIDEDNITIDDSVRDDFDNAVYTPSAFGSNAFDIDDDEEMSQIRRFNIERVLSRSIDDKASDVHITPDDQVAFTILDDIVRYPEFGIVEPKQSMHAYETITNHKVRDDFIVNFELDTSYVLKNGPHKGRRFRVNVSKTHENIAMTLRVISDVIPTPDQLGMDDSVKEWSKLPNGMVLVCGPTGSGKSTTFASLVNEINFTKKKKIITIEKPIEYVYSNKGKALIVQREVGRDTRSFGAALKSAMRQAPNIILVGEVRDREEFDELLRASDSGHLAMSTMHTNSPPATINRIKSLYTGDEQLRVLNTLKDNLRGLVNQVLVKTVDGNSRIAIQVVLEITLEVANMIGKGDSSAMEEHMRKQKTTIEHMLANAVIQGKISEDEAMEHTVFPSYFREVLKSIR